MNRSIRRVALGLGLVFLALFGNLNLTQLARSRELAEHPLNRRKVIEEYSIRRGEILAADGTVLAEARESGDPGFPYRRRYPERDRFGNITGYHSFFYGTSGLERSFNDVLIGNEPATPSNFVDELLGRERAGNVIQLSIDPKLQRLAARALGDQEGAVAAIDPETGAVLALYATPMYDPNLISGGPADEGEVRGAWEKLNDDGARPLTFRATQERYPPGSTMKIIVAAAALESGMTTSTSFPNPRALNLPDTNRDLRNFNRGSCQGGNPITLLRGFQVSCNTTFAQVGMCVSFGYRCPRGLKRVPLATMARRFGMDERLDFDIETTPSCVRSIPGAGCDQPVLSRPATAYSSIGQQDVRATALQMARVAATVQNGGFVPRLSLVQRILSSAGKVLSETKPQLADRIYSRKTARTLKSMMVSVVRQGTGSCVGFRDARKGTIGGKTGTAETGIKGQPPHVWFVAFSPKVAVAVVVENGGNLGRNATGGKVAGPIARTMIEGELAGRRC